MGRIQQSQSRHRCRIRQRSFDPRNCARVAILCGSPKAVGNRSAVAWKRRPEAVEEGLAMRSTSLHRWGESRGADRVMAWHQPFLPAPLWCLTLGTVFVTAVIGVPIRESLMAKQKERWGEPAGPPQHRNSSLPCGHLPALRYLFELRPRRRPARKPPREPAILPVLNAQMAIPAMIPIASKDSIDRPF